jgi:hypothetical protein
MTIIRRLMNQDDIEILVAMINLGFQIAHKIV